jgi:hypothetical protein
MKSENPRPFAFLVSRAGQKKFIGVVAAYHELAAVDLAREAWGLAAIYEPIYGCAYIPRETDLYFWPDVNPLGSYTD